MFVVATAGHVDHGKSTLVRALTGMEPDRFAEERRRGMTIDLGYAWTTLECPIDAPPGSTGRGPAVAFVDVPGHQSFIANMLAGLGPAPAVLFVVAADEGWSRQSGEHLAAIDALGIRHGLLAITRSDLADPGPATDEALARLRTSGLGGVEAVAVSGTTGAGLDALRAALTRLVASLPAPRTEGPVRLWLDRAFTVRGAGTVVTATLGSGSVAVGDRLGLVGRGTVTVRALQSAGVDHDHLSAVARVALNLRGTGTDGVGRGDVLLTPDAWLTTSTVDVRLDAHPATRTAGTHATDGHAPDAHAPDAHAVGGTERDQTLRGQVRLPTQLVLHVGTAAVPVHLRPLAGRDDSGYELARLSLATALPLRAGDRAVLRDPGRQSVAAGVLVLDADPPDLSRRGAARRRAAELADADGVLRPAVEIARRGAVTRRHLERLGVDTRDLRDLGGWCVDPGQHEQWVQRAPLIVDGWAREHPLEPGIPTAAVRRALDVPEPVLDSVVAAAGLRAEAGRITRPTITTGAPVGLGPAEAGIVTLTTRFAERPFAAPAQDELAGLGLGPRELAAAEKAGRLRRLPGGVVVAPDAPARAARVLAGLPQPFTTSAARQALDTTRRVAIPLLEHLDEIGWTERVDAGTRRVVQI